MTLKGNRTMLFAVLLVFTGILEQKWPLMQQLLSPDAYDIGLIVIGIIVGFLRAITDTPMFQAYLNNEPDSGQS